MSRPYRKPLLVLAILGVAVALAACGEAQIDVPKTAPERAGAVLFHERCSGCHTLSAAAAEGSATKIKDREHVDGPNFDQRKETRQQVLYAIRNGGFSGAIMPENIVTGPEAQAVAAFLAKYSGSAAKNPPAPASGG